MADGDDRDRVNSQATRGILFFGVPSQGMDISSLLGMVEGQVNEQFLQNLQHDSSALRNQHRELCAKFPYKTCKIISFYETELSPTAKKVITAKKDIIHLLVSDIESCADNFPIFSS